MCWRKTQYNNKNKWSIKHNTCDEILSNTNQLKTEVNSGMYMSTNILKHILITVEFIFAISHNFEYCHCWTIITFVIINVWTHVFSVDMWFSDSETGFDNYLVVFMLFWYFTTTFLRKTYIFIFSKRNVIYIEQKIFTFGTPTLMAYGPKTVPCEHVNQSTVPIRTWYTSIVGFFRVRVLNPYPKVLYHKRII